MRHTLRTSVLAAVCAALWVIWAEPATAQEPAEQVMIAAGQWAKGQVPAGPLRLDPHRTGRSSDPAVARRVASALGADLGTMEETRQCTDVMDPSTCALASSALLAISAPGINGDEASCRVYAWYRQDDARNPVVKRSWDLTLRRTAQGWEVVQGQRLE